MESKSPDAIGSFEDANDRISWISGYETETEVEAAARQIVENFGLQSFVFSALFRSGEREHYRYLVGCDLDWCFLYNQNKWYAIDPFIDYALKHTSPILASDIPLNTPGQERLMAEAAEHGFRSGIVVPAQSSSAIRIGILYLGTSEGQSAYAKASISIEASCAPCAGIARMVGRQAARIRLGRLGS
jgi:hypothetical protein